MKRMCRCHGLTGSCTVETCWEELPTYFEVGDLLKIKYDNALKVSVELTNGEEFFTHYDPILSSYIRLPQSDTNLVYLEEETDLCSQRENFTLGRRCLPRALLDAQMRGELKASSTAEYFPPCEEFCCSGEYREESMSVSERCDCHFVWCCNVECQTCTTNTTEYRCTG